MTYTIETADNSTRTITDTETSLRAAKATARSRRNDSVGGNGTCTISRDGKTLMSWCESAQGWYRACL